MEEKRREEEDGVREVRVGKEEERKKKENTLYSIFRGWMDTR